MVVALHHRTIARNQRLKVGIEATGGTRIEERRPQSEMVEETARGARIEDFINQTAKIRRGVCHLRGGGGDLYHLRQIPEEEIRGKRSDAHAGAQARRGPLAVSRRTTVKALGVRFERLPTPQGPATPHHQIPTNTRSGVPTDHLLLELIGLDRATEHIDRSTKANNHHPAPRIHLRALRSLCPLRKTHSPAIPQ